MGHEHDAEMAKYGTPEQREQRLADLRKEMETKEGRTAYQNEVARELTAIEVEEKLIPQDQILGFKNFRV